jgi:hypothetical protein
LKIGAGSAIGREENKMKLLKAWWPSILAAVAALWGVFGPQVQALVSAHPAWTAGLGGAAIVIAHLLPSPTAKA